MHKKRVYHINNFVVGIVSDESGIYGVTVNGSVFKITQNRLQYILNLNRVVSSGLIKLHNELLIVCSFCGEVYCIESGGEILKERKLDGYQYKSIIKSKDEASFYLRTTNKFYWIDTKLDILSEKNCVDSSIMSNFVVDNGIIVPEQKQILYFDFTNWKEFLCSEYLLASNVYSYNSILIYVAFDSLIIQNCKEKRIEEKIVLCNSQKYHYGLYKERTQIYYVKNENSVCVFEMSLKQEKILYKFIEKIHLLFVQGVFIFIQLVSGKIFLYRENRLLLHRNIMKRLFRNPVICSDKIVFIESKKLEIWGLNYEPNTEIV